MSASERPPTLPGPSWTRLIDYFRTCLEQEQADRLQVAIDTGGFALLENHTDTLLTTGAQTQPLTHPTHIQRARQLAARLRATGGGTWGYAYPVVRGARQWIPLCYTAVTLEAAGDGGLLIRRVGHETYFHRPFLKYDADLSEGEIAALITALRDGRGRDLAATLSEFLSLEDLKFHGLLFPLEPDGITAGLARDLKWIGQQAPDRLSPALRTYMGMALPPAPPPPASAGFVTAVLSNPAQNAVLRDRHKTLQVVAGPPGTGKTQTIINLIATAAADGQTVLFISKNNKAVDNVHDAFRRLGIFGGLLRLGHRELRREALHRARRLLDEERPPIAGRVDEMWRESRRLGLQLAEFENELLAAERAQSDLTEAIRLQEQAAAALRRVDIYGWARDLAAQITPPDAAAFRSEHMAGLRAATAMMARWEAEPCGCARLLQRLGLLDAIRLRGLRARLQKLGLPAVLRLELTNLTRLCHDLLNAELAYPYLYATARRILAEQALGPLRTEAVRAGRDAVAAEKQAADRLLMDALWRDRLGRALLNPGEIGRALDLELQIAGGSNISREMWAQRAGSFRTILTLFPVICCTNLSLPGSVPNEAGLFDLVILDEASQSDIASLLPALFRARRACIVGDDQQLRHISSIDPDRDEALMQAAGIAGQTAFRYSDQSAFDRACRAAGQPQVRLLDRHYRCVPDIIQFNNAEFYGGRLRVERPQPNDAGGDLPLYGFWLDHVSTGSVVYRSTRTGTSATNADEARRLVWLARQYAEQGHAGIGVVTPFRGQKLLLQQMLLAAADETEDPALREALKRIEVGTIHTFQGGQKEIMLFSTVVAPGARPGTTAWFSENRNLVNVAISRAQNLLIVVCHRDTLLAADGILHRMAQYAANPYTRQGMKVTLPPGLQPARFGLRADERDVLADWLNPGAVLAVLNPGERELYDRLKALTADRPVWLAPKVRVLDILDVERHETTGTERDYAFRAHFDLAVIDGRTLMPVAAVELDGRQHRVDPLTQARDRLKESLCHKAGLPLIRVRWGDWGALDAVRALLPGGG